MCARCGFASKSSGKPGSRRYPTLSGVPRMRPPSLIANGWPTIRVEFDPALHGPRLFDGADICAPCAYETIQERLYRMEHCYAQMALHNEWALSRVAREPEKDGDGSGSSGAGSASEQTRHHARSANDSTQTQDPLAALLASAEDLLAPKARTIRKRSEKPEKGAKKPRKAPTNGGKSTTCDGESSPPSLLPRGAK